MTLVGTQRKNKPEITALFLNGKQREVYLSILGFTSNLTLVWHVPARNKAVILLSLQHHDDMCMGEEKDHKCEIIMHNNATKSGFDILDKLMREYTSTTSTRHRHFKLFLSLIAVTFVNAIVLWMLKYPNWQQKKNN
jgi:hypothetical protein